MSITHGNIEALQEADIILWHIPDYFSRQEAGFYYESPKFQFLGTTWSIVMYPNGDREFGTVGFVGLYILSHELKDFYVSFWASIVAGERKLVEQKCYVSKKYHHTTFEKFIKRSVLISYRSLFTPEGSLTIKLIGKPFCDGMICGDFEQKARLDTGMICGDCEQKARLDTGMICGDFEQKARLDTGMICGDFEQKARLDTGMICGDCEQKARLDIGVSSPSDVLIWKLFQQKTKLCISSLYSSINTLEDLLRRINSPAQNLHLCRSPTSKCIMFSNKKSYLFGVHIVYHSSKQSVLEIEVYAENETHILLTIQYLYEHLPDDVIILPELNFKDEFLQLKREAANSMKSELDLIVSTLIIHNISEEVRMNYSKLLSSQTAGTLTIPKSTYNRIRTVLAKREYITDSIFK